MSWNSGYGFDIGAFNVSIESPYSYTGLTFLKCANWAEGPTHGGIQTEYVVDTCWDYITEYENINGAIDYRKGFVKNYGEASTGSCILRPAFVAPTDLVGRLEVTIAAGTTADNMSSKPADTEFYSSLSASIDPGLSQPVWLRREITAGGSPANSYLGIGFVLTVSET